MLSSRQGKAVVESQPARITPEIVAAPAPVAPAASRPRSALPVRQKQSAGRAIPALAVYLSVLALTGAFTWFLSGSAYSVAVAVLASSAAVISLDAVALALGSTARRRFVRSTHFSTDFYVFALAAVLAAVIGIAIASVFTT